MLLMLLLQAAPLPDIQIGATVTARSVTIEKRGEARLEVRAEPDAGSLVKVEAPKANGRRRLNNVRVDINAEARIGTPLNNSETGMTSPR